MIKSIKNIGMLAFLTLLVGCSTIIGQQDKANSLNDANPKLTENINLEISNVYTGTTAAAVESGAFILDINGDNSYNIKFIDYNKCIMTFLCSSIACTHDNEECNSWVPPSVGGCDIVTDSNNLYLFLRGSSITETPPTIYKMAFNGSQKTKLWEFEANQTISLPVVMDETSLYVATSDTKMIGGKLTTESGIVSINKSTGKSGMIYEYEDGANFILGVDGKRIIMKKIEGNLHSVYYIDTLGNKYESSAKFKTNEKIEFIADKILYLNLSTKKLKV